MRTAAYTRGIKEFVLEFCSARGALYNVTRAGYAFLPPFSLYLYPTPSPFLALFPFGSRPLSRLLRPVYQARLRIAFVTDEEPLEMIVDRRTRVL